jgi:hypothetical protein
MKSLEIQIYCTCWYFYLEIQVQGLPNPDIKASKSRFKASKPRVKRPRHPGIRASKYRYKGIDIQV